MNFFSFFRQELAIDLGTANTLIIQNGEVVVDEPSIVAINRKTGLTIAVGTRAMNMHEKTHDDIRTVRPLKMVLSQIFKLLKVIKVFKIIGNSFFSTANFC